MSPREKAVVKQRWNESDPNCLAKSLFRAVANDDPLALSALVKQVRALQIVGLLCKPQACMVCFAGN